VTVSTFNTEGQLVSTELSAPDSPTIGVSFDYTSDGQVADESRTSNGTLVVGTSNTYDSSGNLTGIVEVDAEGDVIDGFDYTYNGAGQVTSEADDPAPGVPMAISMGVSGAGATPTSTTSGTLSGTTTNDAYDAAGQLVGAGTTTYQYDANGNRISSGYKIGLDNEILSDGTWNYSYDPDGNLIGKTNRSTGVSWVYAYDDANRLTTATEYSVAHQQIYEVALAYDVFGNLLQESVWTGQSATASVERFAYNGTQAWAEFSDNNALVTRYLSETGDTAPLAGELPSGVVSWYLTDALGSVRDIVNDDGVIVDHIDYDAYGNMVSQTNPSESGQYLFAGMQFIAVVGIYYDHARDYDPETGTWTTQDPVGFDSGDTNPYRYAGNSPTNATDPTGMWSLYRWIFAGDGNASDEVYAAATQAAGESLLGNSETAKTALNVISVVDPTPISDTLGAGISYVQGNDQQAAQELALAALPGSASVAAKGLKKLKTIATKADDVARLASKADDAVDAGQQANKASSNLCQAGNPKCFPAGTLVSTYDGHRAIEKIDVGDFVWGYDLVTGAWRPCRVLQTFKTLFQGHSVFVTLKAEGEETIEATLLHPFWVVQGEGLEERPIREDLPDAPDGGTTAGRWVDAGDLRPGDQLLIRSGQNLRVHSIRIRPYEDDVYNLDVDDLHCYAVGWSGVVVHNTCGEELTGTSTQIAASDSTVVSRISTADAGVVAPSTMRGAPTNLGPASSKAPYQVTPGVRELEGHYINDRGVSQPWRAHYDQYGRLTGRTDYNAGNRTAKIPDIHHHTYQWGPGMTPMESGSHLPGELVP
jgi:RHS repeat-associated protein